MSTNQKQTRQLQKAAPANFNPVKFVNEAGSKSEAIRKLTVMGYSRGDVAQLLGLRYQHVRNVLITPVKNPGKNQKSGRVATDEDVKGL